MSQWVHYLCGGVPEKTNDTIARYYIPYDYIMQENKNRKCVGSNARGQRLYAAFGFNNN